MKCFKCFFHHITLNSEYCWLYEYKHLIIPGAFTNECVAFRTREEFIQLIGNGVKKR